MPLAACPYSPDPKQRVPSRRAKTRFLQCDAQTIERLFFNRSISSCLNVAQHYVR
jgi:hypothetical protein